MRTLFKYLFASILITSSDLAYSQAIINIPVGTSEAAIQQLIDSNPTAGTTFKFAAGKFRIGNLIPKEGQVFEGTVTGGILGTTLSGARELTGHRYCPTCCPLCVPSNGFPYVYEFSSGIEVDAPVHEFDPIGCGNGTRSEKDPLCAACHSSSPYCNVLQDIFIDGTPLNPSQWQWETTVDSNTKKITVLKIFLSVDPTSKTVELGEKGYAFYGHPGFVYSYKDETDNGQDDGQYMVRGKIIPNVTVKNFIIEKYASQAQSGAVEAGLNWKIENNEIRLNHGGGIRFHSDVLAPGLVSIVRNNYVHNNGQIGIVSGVFEWKRPDTNSDASNFTTTNQGLVKLQSGIYPHSSQVPSGYPSVLHIPSRESNGGLVELNTISHNNYAGYNSSWEAGGTKFSLSNNLRVYKNVSRDNFGPGFWTDIENINTSYEGNLAFNNKAGKGNNGNGIFHEVSYLASIRCNILYNNEQTANNIKDIQLSTSKDVTIRDNKIGKILVKKDTGRGASYFDGLAYDLNSGYHVVQFNRIENGGVAEFVNGAQGSGQIINNVLSDNLFGPPNNNNSFSYEQIITGPITSSKIYYFPKIKTNLTTTSSQTTNTTHLRAWWQVLLQPGFTAFPGFLAETCNCTAVENPGSSLVANGGARIGFDGENLGEQIVTETLSNEAEDNSKPYPNPNPGKFQILVEEGSTNIEVVDLLGSTIFSEHISNWITVNKLIEIPNVTTGIYLLKITNRSKTVVHKILITN